MAATNVGWVSVDPVRCKVDYYPRHISERLEAARSSGCTQCVLGPDFFNATVHFRDDGPFQTTPGQYFGAGGYKQPGFRTAKRLLLATNACKQIIPTTRVYGQGLRFNNQFRPLPRVTASHFSVSIWSQASGESASGERDRLNWSSLRKSRRRAWLSLGQEGPSPSGPFARGVQRISTLPSNSMEIARRHLSFGNGAH